MTSRQRLANRRDSESFAFECGRMAYIASISRFPNGDHKCGSDADTAAKDSAVVCSIALQHGVPLETIRRALLRDSQGHANGPLGIVLDLIAAQDRRRS